MVQTVYCTTLPKEVTDFAFDHLHDEFGKSNVDLDYNNQQVTVTDDSDERASEVKEAIEKYALEKVQDLLFETKNGYDTGFEVNELYSIQQAVTTSLEVREE